MASELHRFLDSSNDHIVYIPILVVLVISELRVRLHVEEKKNCINFFCVVFDLHYEHAVLDVDAEANVRLVCRDDVQVVLEFDPGVFIAEHRKEIDGDWNSEQNAVSVVISRQN